MDNEKPMDQEEPKKPLEKPLEELIEKPIAEPRPEEDVLRAVLEESEDELIPWESITLPSRGLYYGGAIPDGKIEVRAFGIWADKALATTRLAQSGQALDHIYKKCVRTPGKVDPYDLIVGDRVFLLYYLRGITHGNIYEFLVSCSNDDCENSWTVEYDLNQLADTIQWANEELGQEPFKVVLPYLSKHVGQEFWVKVRFLRGSDMNTIMQRRRFAKKLRPSARARARKGARDKTKMSEEALDKTVEENLNLVITEVMKSKSAADINALVSKMHATDTATIREFLRDNTPGIDTSIDVECPECGNSMTLDLPITESFFRPTGQRNSGKRVECADESKLPS